MPRKNKKKSNPYTPLVPSSEFVVAASLRLGQEESPRPPEQSNSDSSLSFSFPEANSNGEVLVDDAVSLLANLNLVGTQSTTEEDEIPTPLYYGWLFKDESIRTAMKEIGMAYLQQCYFAVAQFERFVTSACEKRGVKDHMSYYQYPGKNRKTRELPDFHVTAKFCGRERQPSQEYGKQFAHLAGTETAVNIVGLYFTENSYGFRVKLTEDQSKLFDEREICSSSRKAPVQPSVANECSGKGKHSHNHSKEAGRGLMISEYHPGILLAPQEINFSPTFSRAHITIGCAPSVKAVQAGEDLLDLINLESRVQTLFSTDYVLANGDILRQFGRYGDAFVVYLSKKFVINAEFNYKR